MKKGANLKPPWKCAISAFCGDKLSHLYVTNQEASVNDTERVRYVSLDTDLGILFMPYFLPSAPIWHIKYGRFTSFHVPKPKQVSWCIKAIKNATITFSNPED